MNRTQQFEQHQPYLFGIAYRMLGSAMDAEDMVQETYLRWQATADQPIESPQAYLTSIVTRLCIDHLRSAQVKRESYIGQWLPEPMPSDLQATPDDNVALSESLSMAFLVLLEKLSPTERAAFLLREVFNYSYSEIAQITDKSEANCRQLVRRAKQHVHRDRPRYKISQQTQQQMVFQLVEACMHGDVEGLVGLLAEDVRTWVDGGGKSAAALNPIYGANKVTRHLLAITRNAPPNIVPQFAIINQQPGLIFYQAETPYGVMLLNLILPQPDQQPRIRDIHVVVNPDKLGQLPPFRSQN